MEETGIPVGLRPQELEIVYAINRAIAQSVSIDAALDQIVKLTRNIFIFDNMVVYLRNEDDWLDPSYARVIGRGRTAAADLAWGGTVAQEAYQSKRTKLYREKLEGWEQNRLNWRDFLGLPLHSGGAVLGVLVFGRFGGPPYTQEQVRLAEFISTHISQLLEHQKLVEQIAELEAERRLRRMQEEFISTVSHELCTPLGFIKGYVTTLLRSDINWDEVTRKEFLTVIDEEADGLRELIDNLLDSSRLQAGMMHLQLQLVSLNQLLSEVATRAISRYQGMVVQVQVKPELFVEGDPLRLAQVFDNLLSNAHKYAPASAVHLLVDNQEGQVHISVQDKGLGIAPEHMIHLFERFYRVPDVNSNVHGTGLGLYICREIIEAHGGKISVESEVPGGTTFHIYLPHKISQENKENLQEKV